MAYNRKQEDRRRRRRGPPPEILRKGHGHRARNEVTEEEDIEQQLEHAYELVPDIFRAMQGGKVKG